MQRQQAFHEPQIWDNEGDTLIFIDPPSRQPGLSDEDYEHIVRRSSKPFLMRSDKLIQASTLFKELLSSTRQFRTIRRRGLVNKLPHFVRYVLDLTPPAEGEDAVYLTASLSCSDGVRFWHQAAEIWHVSDALVLGELEPAIGKGGPIVQHESSFEYSPMLHRAAIVRVLAAIQRQYYKLDSAVKVWTTTVVANYLGLTTQSCTDLSDSILTWLRVEPNSHFIEVNPEITMQIADKLQNEDLARDSFAILVGEKALESVSQKDYRTSTTFGRKKEDLPEMWRPSVEYASQHFIERNFKDFEQLIVQDSTSWIERLPTMRQLNDFTDLELIKLSEKLKSTLKWYIKTEIESILDSSFTVDFGNYVPRQGLRILPRRSKLEVLQCLDTRARLFTRSFWEKLRSDVRSN